ncbi:MAG: RES domain-containing protein [Cyclobacteriaceae bacterium]|nr:RES domain-containing protein [Cyclobacteriaceae bacterium HetDA_MAG_MS6]
MTLYHINKWKYRNIWPPEGSLFAEGRWNKPGQWIIYTSPTISLAKLEILANESMLPLQRICMTIAVDDSAEVYEIKATDLPQNWADSPYPKYLNQFTADFLQSSHLILKVPSAQSPREHNYLLNVRHSDFLQLVHLQDISSEPFDPRLK